MHPWAPQREADLRLLLQHPRFEGVAARVLRREPAVVLETNSLMHAPSDPSSLSEVYHGARHADGESVDGDDDAAMAPGRVLRVRAANDFLGVAFKSRATHKVSKWHLQACECCCCLPTSGSSARESNISLR